MRKKICTLLTTALVLGLSACSSSDELVSKMPFPPSPRWTPRGMR